MDFGIATFENTLLNGGATAAVNYDEKTSNINNPKTRGSGFLKQERSDPVDPPDDDQETFSRSSKTARTDSFDPPNKTMPHLPRSDSLLSVSAGDGGAPPNNMLSFSSNSTTTTTTSAKNGNQSSVFSFYQPPPAYIRNAGFGSGGLQAGMHVPVSRYKGPFTPSQWMELEHQALIYKHIVANVPVPSHLLNPLRKSLNPFLFSGSSLSSYSPNSYGWGTFHLGFSGNTDPEPGRCRRTDGKKWRCSRDAVPDQKYCERHINRGRHRSRKPVEGQNGHAVSGPTSAKVGPVASSSSVPISSRGTPNNIPGGAIHNQFKTLNHHNAAIAASAETPINRTQETQAFSMISPTITLKSKEDSSISIQKQHKSIQESSLYSSDKNPYSYSANGSSFLDQDAQNQNPLRHFTDEWPKDQADRNSVAWPEELKPDWTQLSMSIPMAASDFSSSSNSPTQEKLTVAPLSLSHEIDPAHKQATNWIPISWGNSMGGPLGEVLNRTSSGSGRNNKNAASATELNHVMTEMWDLDGNNYRLGSSPTGVLQKTTFVSLSNSSSGSSPRGSKRECLGGGSLCDEMFLSTHASSSSFPPSL